MQLAKSLNEKGKGRERLAISLIVFFLLPPLCFGSALKKELEITLEGKRIEEMSSSGLTIHFIFRVVNTSSAEYRLTRTTTRVLVNQSEFFRLDTTLDSPIPVPPSAATLITVPVKITYDYLFQTIPGLEGLERFSCLLSGLFSFTEPRRREVKIPLAASADFPLFRDFEVNIQPLQVKSVSLGGAELTFAVTFSNKNSSTWIFRGLRYRLELAGKEVSNNQETFQESLDPAAEKTLEIPLLLDFFERGRELQSFLEAADIEASFSGEMEIESEWGRFWIPFSRKQKIVIQRVG